MELTALLLPRMQWGFTILFHIIFPAFTIGPVRHHHRGRRGPSLQPCLHVLG
jgi:hypothetical protein